MVLWLSWSWARPYVFPYKVHSGFNYVQKFSLVNVKLKWVKDSALDATVANERDLKAVCTLVYIIASNPRCCLPVYHLSRSRGQLGISHDLKISTFIRKYPNIFDEFYVSDSGGTPVPWFRLTSEAVNVHREEVHVHEQCQNDILDRLRKLLMLCKDGTLPLQTIDQLKWDMALPYDFRQSFIPRYPELFSFVQLPHDRVGVKLLSWDERLAVSHLQRCAALLQRKEDVKNGTLAFPIGFTRGFGLNRKCMEWLEEWQRLPYTSPYADASHMDPRTDASEKRIVGVFHELLHLTIQKRTERKNVSNLRKPLALPQKFTKVFERHPGIFYISKKCDTQTVILREAYDRNQLIEKHPLAVIRERYATMMKKGFLDKSRGLHRKSRSADGEKIICKTEHSDRGFKSGGDSECDVLSEYESAEVMDSTC